MTNVLPIGYVTLSQAAEILEASLFAGVPDKTAVIRHRQMGDSVRDGAARDCAIAEIWKAVDLGTVRPMVAGGRPRRMVRLDPAITEEIPALRSPRGRGFTLLRPRDRAFHQLAAWFGRDLSNLTLAFREREIQKLGHRLVRTRRRVSRSADIKKKKGTPPRQPAVRPIICNIIETGKWTPLMGVKALAHVVNRLGKWSKPVSEDTIARALDHLHDETQDRQYQRTRRARR